MKKDLIFRNSAGPLHDFEFSAEVAEVFEDMLERSIPFYAEQQTMIQNLCKSLWVPGSTIYDLGCSTGTAMIGLSQQLPSSAHFVGYDNSVPMLERAGRNIQRHHLGQRIELRQGDLNARSPDLRMENAGIVLMCWTLQFIRPLQRDFLIRSIYDSLVDGGVLIVTEKTLTDSGHMNRFFIDLYYDFKRRRGYSDAEIGRKREALENVLIPYRLNENMDLFRRNGFALVDTFFQWFNFVGFLCVKRSDASAHPAARADE